MHLHSSLLLLCKAVYVCRAFWSVRMGMVELMPTQLVEKEDYRKACSILVPEFFFQIIKLMIVSYIVLSSSSWSFGLTWLVI